MDLLFVKTSKIKNSNRFVAFTIMVYKLFQSNKLNGKRNNFIYFFE
jgi:hypothetical protein